MGNPMTKIQDEMKAAKQAASNFKQTCDNTAPSWFVKIVNGILYHPGTPWFCLGMAMEAFGLSIQYFLTGASYPLVDGFIAVAIALLIAKRTGVKLV